MSELTGGSYNIKDEREEDGNGVALLATTVNYLHQFWFYQIWTATLASHILPYVYCILTVECNCCLQLRPFSDIDCI